MALILVRLPRHVSIGKQDVLLVPGEWPSAGLIFGVVLCVVGVALEGRAIMLDLQKKEGS